MAQPFFRETRAVQMRTAFGDAPCLKLSVYRYTYTNPATTYVNRSKPSPVGEGRFFIEKAGWGY